VSLRIFCPHCQRVCQLDDEPDAGLLACPRCGGAFALRRPPDALLAPAEPTAPSLPPHRRAHAEEPLRELSLEGGPPLAWIDRVLPARPLPFLLVVFGISTACWLLGLALAADREKFLDVRRCKEWYAQLLYLPAHFIALRLFVTLYTRNFMAGVAHLDIPLNRAWRAMRWVLGPVGLLALVLAAPLCVMDFFELAGPKYRDSLVGSLLAGSPAANAVGAADRLMWGVWCLEWIINAYIWVLLLGFLFLTMRILRTHSFRDPVEVVLHEKQYRPFLLMSGQGASIVLGFTVVTGLYVWFAEGALTDYIGIAVTVVLLVLGFCPPWLQIKASVEKVVNAEIFQLREGLIAEHRHQAELARQGVACAADLNTRMSEMLVILRIDYLDRLSGAIGHNEGVSLLLKLLAPLGAVGWRVVRMVLGLP
jgi:hypothetical protein